MSQEKAAEIISFNAPRSAPASAHLNDGETVGGFLLAARERARLSIEDVSAATKVKVTHLQALEAGQVDELPALPYTVGFVKAYARFLGVDEDALAARYREEVGAQTPAEAAMAPLEPEPSPSSFNASTASIAAIVVIMLFGAWVVFQVSGNEAEETRAAAEQGVRVRVSEAPAVTPTPRAAQDEGRSAAEAVVITQQTEGMPEDAVETLVTASDVLEAETVDGEGVDEAVSDAEEDATASEAAIAIAETGVSPRMKPAAPFRDIVESTLRSSSAPDYPERCAVGARAVESVTLVFDISPGGRASNVRVTSSTNTCFEYEAIRTMARWRFRPRQVNGDAVIDGGKTATLNFRL